MPRVKPSRCGLVYAPLSARAVTGVKALFTIRPETGGMIHRALLALPLLCACGAQPAPEFWGAERRELAEGDQRYTLFLKEDRFEVIRTGPYLARRATREAVQQRMLTLVEGETGCKIKETGLRGDAGEIRGKLRCPRGSG